MNQELPQREKIKYFVGNEAVLPTDLSILDPVAQEIMDRLIGARWPEDQADSLIKACLVDAISNAMKHGNKRDPDKKVWVTLDIAPDRAVISVRDQGDGFEPEKVPDPTEGENVLGTSGRGIYMMRRIFDKVEFNEKGNEVVLTKNRRTQDT